VAGVLLTVAEGGFRNKEEFNYYCMIAFHNVTKLTVTKQPAIAPRLNGGGIAVATKFNSSRSRAGGWNETPSWCSE
jgi:hypothetical protein